MLRGNLFPYWASAVEFGEHAGIIVDERRKGKAIATKFASAHDLRRAFGLRWALRVMPAVLKELMRHETVETTMKYYVGQNAETIADTIWNVLGDTLGDTPISDENAPETYSSQTLAK